MLRFRPGVAIPAAEIRFSADTSGGKGGQHANRSSTRVELRFDVLGSPSLSPRQRGLIAEKLGPRLGADGTLRVVSARESSISTWMRVLSQPGQWVRRELMLMRAVTLPGWARTKHRHAGDARVRTRHAPR